MKCPSCWTERAYLRRVSGWKGILLACLLLRPMKCLQCCHQFLMPWVFTLGKQVTPPASRIAPSKRAAGLSYAAQHCATREAWSRETLDPTDSARARFKAA